MASLAAQSRLRLWLSLGPAEWPEPLPLSAMPSAQPQALRAAPGHRSVTSHRGGLSLSGEFDVGGAQSRGPQWGGSPTGGLPWESVVPPSAHRSPERSHRGRAEPGPRWGGGGAGTGAVRTRGGAARGSLSDEQRAGPQPGGRDSGLLPGGGGNIWGHRAAHLPDPTSWLRGAAHRACSCRPPWTSPPRRGAGAPPGS